MKQNNLAGTDTLENRTPTYSGLILAVTLLSALLFNGLHIYFLSFTWLSLILFVVYQLSLSKKIPLFIDGPIALSLLLLLWMLVSYYWHPVPWVGMYYDWRLAIMPVSLLVIYLFSRQQEAKGLLVWFTLIALVDVLLTLHQSISLRQSADGLFINRNNNAAFINLFLIPLSAVLVLSGLRPKMSVLVGALVFTFLLAVLQVASRGAFIGLAVGMSVIIAMAILQKRYKALAFLFSIIVATIAFDHVVSTSEMKHSLESPSRWSMWASAIHMIEDGGWKGIGNGMFYLVYPQYRQPDDHSMGFFVHNDYLQFLLEIGVPGVLMFAGLLGIVFFAARKIIFTQKVSDDFAVHLGFAAAVLSVATHSLVTFNFYKTGILFVVGIYSGLILRRAYSPRLNEKQIYSIRVSNAGILLSFMLMLFVSKSVLYVGYADAIADGVLGNAVFSTSAEKRFQTYSYLWKLDPTNYRYPYLMAAAYSREGSSASYEKRKNIYKTSYDLLAQAKSLNPFVADIDLYQSDVVQQFKDIVGNSWKEKSITLAKDALTKNPVKYSVRYSVAKHLDVAGNKEAALRVLLDGLVYTPSGDLAYFEYGEELAKELEKSDEAKLFAKLAEDEKHRIDMLTY